MSFALLSLLKSADSFLMFNTWVTDAGDLCQVPDYHLEVCPNCFLSWITYDCQIVLSADITYDCQIVFSADITYDCLIVFSTDITYDCQIPVLHAGHSFS